MTEFNIASVSDLAHVLSNFKDATRHIASIKLEWDYAALAVDMLEEATAEQLLIALRKVLREEDAKTIVGILLEAGLTLDKTLDDMGGELGDGG